MNESKLNRRQLIITATGASLAALLPSRMFGQAPTGTATASPRASTGNTPGVQTAGNLHTKSLDEISAVLGGAPIVSENGLTKMIDHLVATRLITREEGEVLKNVVHALFRSTTLEDLEKVLTMAYAQLQKTAQSVAVAIIEITRSSVDYAKRLASNIPVETVLKYAAIDFTGGVSAASVAAKLPPALQALVVAGGAVGSSAVEYFKTERPATKR